MEKLMLFSLGLLKFDLAAELRNYDWITPAYFLPTAPDKVSIMRIVVHEDFSIDQADHFTRDITHVIQNLEKANKKRLYI
jgi:glutamate decarboxylase